MKICSYIRSTLPGMTVHVIFSLPFRISAYNRSITNPYRSTSTYQSAYVPYYRRQQEQNERREREREAKLNETTTTSQPTSVTATLSSVTTATTTVPTVSSLASCPSFGTNYSYAFRRFVPSFLTFLSSILHY